MVHKFQVHKVSWHGKGDYFTSLCPIGNTQVPICKFSRAQHFRPSSVLSRDTCLSCIHSIIQSSDMIITKKCQQALNVILHVLVLFYVQEIDGDNGATKGVEASLAVPVLPQWYELRMSLGPMVVPWAFAFFNSFSINCHYIDNLGDMAVQSVVLSVCIYSGVSHKAWFNRNSLLDHWLTSDLHSWAPGTIFSLSVYKHHKDASMYCT